MKKKKFLFGFSLVETIIIIAALAIVVAAATPIITRKLINISDIGAALGGGSHGRYEIYTKEILTFGPNRRPIDSDPANNPANYKRTNPSNVQNTVFVYEKKDDVFYKKMTGTSPVTGAGKTSTLYEEIPGVTPVKDPKTGRITSATKNVDGKVVTYVAGSKYIFEDADAQYTSTAGNILNKNQNRIIEGNLTNKFAKLSPAPANNTLWQLTVKKENEVGGGVEGYEKVTDPSIPDKLIVYERKDDKEYEDLTGGAPGKSGELKSTLYEEIKDAKPIKDKDGTITQAEIKINGKKVTVKNDSKYIFENQQVTYIKGTVKIVNGVTTFIPDNKGKTIDRDKNRIIEGNFTDRYSKDNPKTHNALWHIKANSGNFDGDVVTIPWERVVSGSKEIVDRPIPPDSDGNYTGTFTPPDTAVQTVIHAVGGGGAGGGPSEDSINAYADPKNADRDKIDLMKKQLAKRFKEVAKNEKGYNLDAISYDTLVKEIHDPNFSTKNYPNLLMDENTYIILNTANGTITVKVDVRKGMILPHELLDYTKVLGTGTQKAEIHDMPKWFDWQSITDGGFVAGGVACGGKGGDAGDLIWKTTKLDKDCIPEKYRSYDNVGCAGYGSCDCNCEVVCTAKAAKIARADINVNSPNSLYAEDIWMDGGYSSSGGTSNTSTSGTSSAPKKTCENKCDTCKPCTKYECGCKNTEYFYCNSNTNDPIYNTSTCPNSASTDCSGYTRVRNGNPYKRTYKGGLGGSKPACVWLASLVKEKTSVEKYCTANKGHTGQNGDDAKVTDNKDKPGGYHVSNMNGENGKTCGIEVGGKLSISQGGSGGIACVQDLYINETNENVSDREKATADTIHELQKNPIIGGLVSAITGVYKESNSQLESVYALDDKFMCKTNNDAKIYNCGISGTAGKEILANTNDSGVCTFPDGSRNKCMNSGKGRPTNTTTFGSVTYGLGTGEGIYNYIYTWTIPYATNYLGYGEAGKAGEYASTKLPKINGSLYITLGKGGVWTAGTDKWHKSSKGPNGTDTIVNMGQTKYTATKVLVAKGGQGGRSNLKTNNYDLCFANDRDKACADNADVQCCGGIPKTSQEVSATNVRQSLFENIKTFVGKSKIIGIGLGRGAQGAGTAAQEFELFGSRIAVNASAASDFDAARRTVHKKTSPSAERGSSESTSASAKPKDKYKNKYLKPAEINFKGGDGAVIITW